MALLAGLLLAVIPAAAQSWNIEFEIGREHFIERGYSIAGTFDGGAVAIGSADHSLGQQISIVRFDPHGAIVWTRTYSAWANDAVFDLNEFSIKVTEDQQYIWTTSVNYNSISTRDIIVGRCDQLGNPIWTTSYGAAERDDFGSSVIEVSDGFVVSGTSCNPSVNNNCDFVLFKLNSAGMLVWGFSYDDLTTDIGRCVRQDPVGNLVLAGETLCDPSDPNTCRAGFVMKTNAGGIEQWAGHYGADVQSGFAGVEIAANGDYYACGLSIDQPAAADAFIARVNQADGGLISATTYDFHGDTDGLWSITPSWVDGNFVLTGSASDSNAMPGTQRIVAMEVDAGLGAPLWARLYAPLDRKTIGRCITRARRHASPPTNSEGGYWIFGFNERAPAPQMYAMRTDSLSGATSCSECVTPTIGTNTNASLVEVVRSLYKTSTSIVLTFESILQDSSICAGSFVIPDTCDTNDPCPDDCFWKLNGNAGTNPIANYLGTSDNSPLSIRTQGTERLYVATTGNIGIGTQAPTRKLHIDTGPGVFQLRLEDPLGAYDLLGGSDFHIREAVSGTTRLFIQGGSGNVGIGTTAPTHTLSVNGTACKPGGGPFAACSDARLKTDISPYTDGLDMLRRIEPVWFRYNGLGDLPTDESYVGIIAQEMREIAPYTVGTSTMKLRDSDAKASEMLSFDGNALTYMTINAVKELDLRLANAESLRRENEELQRSIAELRMVVAEIQSRCCAAGGGLKQPDRPVDQETSEQPRLFQNAPNPFDEVTYIEYYLPPGMSAAKIIFHDEIGREVLRLPLQQRGSGKVELNAGTLSPGSFQYSLVVDGNTIETHKMLLTR